MVGEGELRHEMEDFIQNHSLADRVLLTGFINQSQMPYYYLTADVYVMCSGLGETWGLSVNEAMNVGLPVIVSDSCGSAYDLVKDGINGKVFETGNIENLRTSIESFLYKNKTEREEIKKVSLEILDRYSYKTIIENINKIEV